LTGNKPIRFIGGHVSSAGGIKNTIPNAINIGANCMMFFAGSPRTWSRKLYNQTEVSEFANLSSRHNLKFHFIHALYLVNLGTNNLDLLEKSTQSLLIDLKNGDLISSSGVIVHLGSHQGRGFISVSQQLIQIIKHLLSQTKQVPFIIENSAGQNGKIGQLDEIAHLFNKLNSPRLGLCLDTAHLFGAGHDLSETNLIIEKLTNLSLIDKIKCLHLNDSKAELNSGRDLHANLGEGLIGLPNLKAFINHPLLAHLPLILEVPGDGSGPNSKNISLAKSLVSY
jgi:deoxyribonuclease IV